MLIEVNDLSFSYRSHKVLSGVSFRIEKGELLAILGPNGTGKTTLLKCLNGILKPQKGSITIDGDCIENLGNKELARRIGYVEQNRTGRGVTVFDAVLLGRRPHISWDASEKDLKTVSETLEKMELSSLGSRFLTELSGGELQKVTIARAMVQQSEILIIDEPTNHLDLKNQVDVMKTIRHIVDGQKITAILTMHDINMALRYADRFIMVKENVIFAAGGREVMTADNISIVYGTPVEMIEHQKNPLVIPV